MKVVDIRNVFEKRRIQLFYVDDDFIYYAEEKLQGELSNLYILEYNRDTRRERLVTNYTLEDSSFVIINLLRIMCGIFKQSKITIFRRNIIKYICQTTFVTMVNFMRPPRILCKSE